MRRSIGYVFAAIAVALIVAPSTSAQTLATGYLHRVHTWIVDSAGKPIQLRGLNLGNWLEVEPVAFCIWGEKITVVKEMRFHVRSDLEAMIGREKTDAFYTDWYNNYITQKDIYRIAGWGFNAVRVPLDYRLFYDDKTGADLDTGFIYLDALLDWCAKDKVYVFPDMHVMPGTADSSNTGNIFVDTTAQNTMARIWQRIAARYASNPWMGGYDLLSEPILWDKKNQVLGALYRKLTQAVREVDHKHMIVVEGDVYAKILDWIGIGNPTAPVWDDNLAYSVHLYGVPLKETPDADGTFNIWTVSEERLLAARLDIPLLIGEFGANANSWNNAMKRQFEHPDSVTVGGVTAQTPMGWFFLNYIGSDAENMLKTPFPMSAMPLSLYLNNPNMPKLSSVDAQSQLSAILKSMDHDPRTIERDVVDAITRPDFSTRNVPYVSGQSIPGRIDGVYYDMGREGMAYHDTVSMDDAGHGVFGQIWNNGWNLQGTFRNDGVDTYFSDDGSPGYYIGNIDAGEWVTYTVSCTPGTYDLKIRYAALAEAPHMHALVNGRDLNGQIDLPNTYGWGNFQTITVAHVRVTESGACQLKLAFDTAGFNIDWLEFDKPG